MSSGFNPYQQNAIEHADPVKLVGMMYEGALRFIRRAIKCISDNDPEGAHHNIMRSYAIVAELMATLDFEHGGTIAVNLEQCYDYVLHLLKEANIKKDGAMLDQACKVLEPLLDSWTDAFSGVNRPAVSLALGESANPAGNGAEQPTAETIEKKAPELAATAPAGRKSFDITG